MGSLPAPNHTQVPNRLLDELLPQIGTLGELKVVLAVARQTFGWQRRERRLRLSDIEELTGLARASAQAGVAAALDRGLLRRRKEGSAWIYSLVAQNLGSSDIELSSDVELPESSDPELALKKERKNGREETGPTTPESPGSSNGSSNGTPPPIGFEEWLEHYAETTGKPAPGLGTKRRSKLVRQFLACLHEVGGDVRLLKLATIGAHSDDWRRSKGYDVAESILRTDKVGKLVDMGRTALSPQREATETEQAWSDFYDQEPDN